MFNFNTVKILFICICCCSLFQCAPSRSGVKNVPYKNVVFLKKEAVNFVPEFREVELWIPTSEELKMADDLAMNFISKKKKKDLKNHFRQYFGMMKNGKKIIYLNAICVQPQEFFKKEWRKKLIVVEDGGCCFYQIKIDVETKKCFDFSCNSEV